MPDLSSLLSATPAGPLDSVYVACPEGHYLMTPLNLEIESIQGKKDASKSYTKGTLMFDILDEGVKQRLGLKEIHVPMEFFIDLTPDGRIANGTNVNLEIGQLAKAFGMAGRPDFNLGMCQNNGIRVRGRVQHRQNANNPARPLARVTEVNPAV